MWPEARLRIFEILRNDCASSIVNDSGRCGCENGCAALVAKIRSGDQSAIKVLVVEDVYVGADWWCCQSPGGL